MKPSTLQHLWALVEQMPTRQLLELDDRSLIEALMRQLQFQPVLDSQELDAVRLYLHARLGLIRDVADARPQINYHHCPAVQTWTPPVLV